MHDQSARLRPGSLRRCFRDPSPVCKCTSFWNYRELSSKNHTPSPLGRQVPPGAAKRRARSLPSFMQTSISPSPRRRITPCRLVKGYETAPQNNCPPFPALAAPTGSSAPRPPSDPINNLLDVSQTSSYS